MSLVKIRACRATRHGGEPSSADLVNQSAAQHRALAASFVCVKVAALVPNEKARLDAGWRPKHRTRSPKDGLAARLNSTRRTAPPIGEGARRSKARRHSALVQAQETSVATMKAALIALGVIAGVLPVQPALACPPPPPGWVPPTETQFLANSLSGVTDIVYGVVTRQGGPGEPSLLKVIHVYRGTTNKGDTIAAPPGYGHPIPVCAGMGGPPIAKPAGAYGVVAWTATSPALNFIKPEHVQIMIREGWIKSAQAR
jgi:hypothetical protein